MPLLISRRLARHFKCAKRSSIIHKRNRILRCAADTEFNEHKVMSDFAGKKLILPNSRVEAQKFKILVFKKLTTQKVFDRINTILTLSGD